MGSGAALSRGGPLSLLLAFLLIGATLVNVIYALGELAIMYPISGGFYTYSTRFIDPSWGFAMGWNYCLQWSLTLPLEMTVAAEVIKFWRPDIHVSIWISMFLLVIVLINVFGVRGYGEEEFWASALKLTAIGIFVVIGLVLVLGGGPKDGVYDEYQGARLWHEGAGPIKNGFPGFCSVFVTATFAYAGTELVGLAAAESKTPVKSLPTAVKLVFWRVAVFYVLPLLLIGFLVNSNDERLFGSGSPYVSTTASPFVIVAVDGGLQGLDSFICAVIVVSVISIGNAGVYGASRTLTALAEQGYAPKVFSYVDQAGRPLTSTCIMIACGLLAYINCAAAGVELFGWLLALSGLAVLFTWGSICVAHIRFRAAWKYHGHTLDEIPFKALFGVWGSWVSLVMMVLVLVAQVLVAVKPPGGGTNSVEGFFKSCLALPVIICLWSCGYLWKRKGWLSLSEIDVDTGKMDIDWAAIRTQKQSRKSSSISKIILRFLF